MPVTGDDVAAFERRAASYDTGPLGEWHRRLARNVAGIVRELEPDPGSVLDVGCGTGQLLHGLARSLPRATELVGVDPAPAMIAVASAAGNAAGNAAGRVRFVRASAEDLPFRSGTFGVVVSTVSFDHWADQRAGLAECARVLRPAGRLVLADLFAGWLAVTGWFGGRQRARTPKRAEQLLSEAGLIIQQWQPVDRLGPLPLIRAVTAARGWPV